MSKLNVITNTIGSFATNCYTIVNEESGEAVIIDPAERADFLQNMYEENNINPIAILLTHGHMDHIGAIPRLRELYPDIKVYANIAEKELLSDIHENLSADMFGKPLSLEADIYVNDGDVLNLIDKEIKCIAVPGHTIGGMCYYLEEDKLLFSGDTLFAGSVGRSDFPTGDGEALLKNIEEKLLVLPDDVVLLPGHNGKSTIKKEKHSNPYF